MSAETRHFYEFENFRLDPREKVLYCNDKPVSLTPKVFETLQIFVEHAGHLLEKDELMAKIWQDRFVEESNLTFNIKMLRRVLNDDAHKPRFIETVPRRGYRFIADVTENCTSTIGVKTDLSQATPALPAVAAKRSYLAFAAISALVVGSAVIALWFAQRRHATSAAAAPILSTPFESENFSSAGVTCAAISPNGKYVAYASETGNKQSIWLRQLETSENIQIVPPAETHYFGLAISHDGNSLYFARQNEGDPPYKSIYRVMTFGGIPVKTIENTQGSISISPDDRQISFVRCRYQDEDYCSLFMADADGRNERKLLTRQKPVRISDHQLSPDGKSIAFASGQSRNGGNDFRLRRLDLASGSDSLISSKTFFDIWSLKWLPNGEALLLVANDRPGGPMRIWQASTGTNKIEALTNDATNYLSISLDKAADRMIALHTTSTFHVYLAPVGDLNSARSLAAARSFAFSPDGKIVYSSDDNDIWTINRDGGEQRQLTNSSFPDSNPRVSPDGRYIFFCSSRSGSNHIWRMNADGSNQIQLTHLEGGGHRMSVSPDQRWIYFESGIHRNIWKVSSEGGEEIPISDETVYQSALSPDGKLMAYFSRIKDSDNRYRIAVMSLETGKVVKTFALADDNSTPVVITWATAGRGFDYIIQAGSSALWRQSLGQDHPRFIADLGSEDYNDFALSPDGNSVGFIRGRWILGAVLVEGLK